MVILQAWLLPLVVVMVLHRTGKLALSLSSLPPSLSAPLSALSLSREREREKAERDWERKQRGREGERAG